MPWTGLSVGGNNDNPQPVATHDVLQNASPASPGSPGPVVVSGERIQGCAFIHVGVVTLSLDPWTGRVDYDQKRRLKCDESAL
jgi:hypothetical protein